MKSHFIIMKAGSITSPSHWQVPATRIGSSFTRGLVVSASYRPKFDMESNVRNSTMTNAKNVNVLVRGLNDKLE